jgi:CubicO group peptidase (beta-lactamase class C family)
MRCSPRRFLLAVCLLGAQPLSASLAAQLPESARRGVDAVFATFDRTDAPGCAVGVSERGVPVYQRAYGMADLQHRLALSERSIFHVASISKQFAAIAVALLAEDGKLGLDDDVRRYVPELPDHGARITLRQLMHHTSGLRDQWQLLSWSGWRFPADLITERDVLEVLARQRGLNFQPGDEYLYSNSGFTLLAVIVHRVSGRSLREFAEERIFAPLGMRDTHFHDDHTMIVPGRTAAYEPRAGGGWRVSIPVFDTYGATSLFSTTGDLLTWMAHLDQPRFGTPNLWQAAQTSGVLNDGTAINYGYGLALATWRGVRAIGHGGADAGYRAYVERYPEQGVAVAVLCNRANVAPADLARGVAAAVLGDRLPREMVEMRAPPHQPSAAARAAWEGTYRDPVSLAVLRVRVSGDTVTANGQPLNFGSDTTATRNNVPGWLSLQPGSGTRATIRVNPRGLRQVVFERQAAPFPTLVAYEGRFFSEELDTWYRFTVRDSSLVMSHRKLNDVSLVPAGRDAFTYGGSLLVFTRDRRGRVTGFTLNGGRVRGVRFERTPESQPELRGIRRG